MKFSEKSKDMLLEYLFMKECHKQNCPDCPNQLRNICNEYMKEGDLY